MNKWIPRPWFVRLLAIPDERFKWPVILGAVLLTWLAFFC